MISLTSNAQATFEHAYTSEYFNHNEGNMFRTDNGLFFYTFERNTGIVKIYNSSHVLIKTVNIPMETNYYLRSLQAISDKLFNSDNLVEFMVGSYNLSGPTNVYKIRLINENGIVLQEIANKDEAIIVKENDNSFKLIVSNSSSSMLYPIDYDVYSLPGTTLNIVQNQTSNYSLIGFPNPTSNNITIVSSLKNGESGNLEVFDLNGKKVMEKLVTGNGSEINLELTNLNNGVYIYKLNGKINRFIKK